MRIRWMYFWSEVRTSYWFIPSLMIAAAIGLAFGMIALDQNLQVSMGSELRNLWGRGPEGARGLLEVIAGSMITVASLTFSITIVVFSQASTQFGPRLLRNFIRDTGNQFVLGTFVSTFVYCLVVLRAIRTGVESVPGSPGMPEFVPQVSVSIGFGLALFSLGVLIYFIHHVSQSIYAPKVIAAVAGELMDAIERMYPKEEGLYPEAETSGPPDDFPDPGDGQGQQVAAHTSGYLQAIDISKLMATAEKFDLKLAVTHRPGNFVIRGDDLGWVWAADRLDEPVFRQLESWFVIGKQRLAPQDVEFAIDQLVEIAVRALSPAINDPFTAINCIQWLGVGLSRLAQKKIPPPYYTSRDGIRRIRLTRPVTFHGVTDAAFNQIRQHAGNNLAVMLQLLEVIAVIAEHTRDEAELDELERHARMIQRSGHRVLHEQEDLNDLDERYRGFEKARRGETSSLMAGPTA